MLAGSGIACPPDCSISCTVAWISSSVRLRTPTLAPSRANSTAAALPMPDPAPVTSATLPWRSIGSVSAGSSLAQLVNRTDHLGSFGPLNLLVTSHPAAYHYRLGRSLCPRPSHAPGTKGGGTPPFVWRCNDAERDAILFGSTSC